MAKNRIISDTNVNILALNQKLLLVDDWALLEAGKYNVNFFTNHLNAHILG